MLVKRYHHEGSLTGDLAALRVAIRPRDPSLTSAEGEGSENESDLEDEFKVSTRSLYGEVCIYIYIYEREREREREREILISLITLNELAARMSIYISFLCDSPPQYLITNTIMI